MISNWVSWGGMRLPSGPVKTRCSVCRFDPSGVQLPAGARNGFAEPRDREPKSGLSRPQPAAETARPAFEPAKMPANCGLFGCLAGLEPPTRPLWRNQTVMARRARTKDASMGHFDWTGQEEPA